MTLALPEEHTRFSHIRILGDCACCGVIVCHAKGNNPDYRRLHFDLSINMGLLPITLCPVCVAHTWSDQDLRALEQQCLSGWQSWQPSTEFQVTGPSDLPIQSWEEVLTTSIR